MVYDYNHKKVPNYHPNTKFCVLATAIILWGHAVPIFAMCSIAASQPVLFSSWCASHSKFYLETPVVFWSKSLLQSLQNIYRDVVLLDDFVLNCLDDFESKGKENGAGKILVEWIVNWCSLDAEPNTYQLNTVRCTERFFTLYRVVCHM